MSTTEQSIPLTTDESGTGRPVLVLHGGGGPLTVEPLRAHLAAHAHVLTATLPGWNGTPRPEALGTIADYADAYLAHLSRAGLVDVVVIGSSLGGWIAAEMAARDREGIVAAVALLDAAGIDVAEEPRADFYSLTPREIVEHSFHDPDRFFVDPATVPAEQAQRQQANLATMRIVAGDMADPTLRGRLAAVTIPALVLWGDSDRVFTPGYGRAYAAAFGQGRFELVADAGHLPQLEQPAATLALLDAFLAA